MDSFHRYQVLCKVSSTAFVRFLVAVGFEFVFNCLNCDDFSEFHFHSPLLAMKFTRFPHRSNSPSVCFITRPNPNESFELIEWVRFWTCANFADDKIISILTFFDVCGPTKQTKANGNQSRAKIEIKKSTDGIDGKKLNEKWICRSHLFYVIKMVTRQADEKQKRE